jgi:hypothetical protein
VRSRPRVIQQSVTPDPNRLALAISEYFTGYPFQITKSAAELTPQSEEAHRKLQAGVKKSRRLTFSGSASPSGSASLNRRKAASFLSCEVEGFAPDVSVSLAMKCKPKRIFTVHITSASIPLDLDEDPKYAPEELIADYLLHWVVERIVHLTVEELDGRTLGLT